MLVLVETPSGYGLFRVENASLLTLSPKELSARFASSKKTQKMVTLEAFSQFKDQKQALYEASKLINSQVGKGLRRLLKKTIISRGLQDQLAVCDKQLGGAIAKKLGISAVYSPSTNEIIKGIRSQFHDLVSGLTEQTTKTMALSLSHTLNRFKLKFSPEKVDMMVIQAIGLLDDLDRELNNFGMRLKEWYGWHFPELAKIVTDNFTYARVVQCIGFRFRCQKSKKLEKVLHDEILDEVRQAAEISMGTEITDEDLTNIKELASRVEELTENRAALAEYLKFRMDAIAPNLTYMVGEIVGARLVAHAGSLMNLAKHPSSTVQILGAEKALFRALKQKSDKTPKYGLIYHAALVGQTSAKLKGKISRVLAAKLSLCIRMDALGEGGDKSVAIASRSYVERRLEELQNDTAKKASSFGMRALPPTSKYIPIKRGLTAFVRQGDTADTNNVDPSAGKSDAIEQPVAKKRKKKHSVEAEVGV